MIDKYYKKGIFFDFEEGGCTAMRLMMNKIKNSLINQGINVVNDVSDADICIVFTCAAFEADIIRTINMISHYHSCKKEVIAYGCLCAVNPSIINVSKKYLTWEASKLIKDICGHNEFFNVSDGFPHEFSTKNEYRSYDPSIAFLCITFGCSFNCSYCPHKIGVGSPFSVKPEILHSQIKTINSSSTIKTLYLTGTDTACYGFEYNSSFSQLLNEIFKILRDDISIRISQFNPEGIFKEPDQFFTNIVNPRIKEIQLPIQTASPRLLKLMKRNYDILELGSFLENLLKLNNNIYLRTDILVGFPTETEEDIEKTVEFATKYFHEIAIYVYENVPGTEIFAQNFTQIPQNIKNLRYDYCKNTIIKNGRLFHSGGQSLDTLLSCEKVKKSIEKII